ncbi:hypothetical protein [Thalassospira sp. CH_XMU1448-2]|uniref:hypothetical protein n=1 Tax=Thalassospira sp. CH_XMU1448-2 TaxID=3107773 RepID=UPI00300B6AF3
MRSYYKLVFVFSSYAPLFLIAGGKCLFTKGIDPIWGTALLGLGGLGFIVGGGLLLYASKPKERYVQLEDIEAADSEVLIYVLGYLPIIVTAGLDQADQVFSVLATYIVVFSIYILMDKVYVNPLFLAVDFHLYRAFETRGQNKRPVVLISASKNISGNRNLRLKEVSAVGVYYYGS